MGQTTARGWVGTFLASIVLFLGLYLGTLLLGHSVVGWIHH